MTRIAIHDEPKPWGETLAQALLRALIGGLVVLQGFVGLAGLGGPGTLVNADFWQRWLMAFTFSDPHSTGVLRMVTELLAGVGLIVGFWARVCAVVIGLLTLQALVGLYLQYGGLLSRLAAFDGPVLLLGMSAYVLRIGPGTLSVDHALWERARRRAIQKDEIWLRPPYVSRDRTLRRRG